MEFAFSTDPTAGRLGRIAYVAGGSVTSPGLPDIRNFAAVGDPADFRAVFGRRKDYQTAGLTYTVEFSADLTLWTASSAGLQMETGAESTGDIEAVSVPFPATVPVTSGGAELAPKFFRVGVAAQ